VLFLVDIDVIMQINGRPSYFTFF